MAKWIDIGDPGVMDDGDQLCMEVAGRPVVVFRVGEKFHVIENICPHAGLPLGEGERRGLVITCPFHGYTYNLRNGKNIDAPDIEPPVTVYETRIEDGILQAKFEDAQDPSQDARQQDP